MDLKQSHKSRWVVFTGASCSGKSTTAARIQERSMLRLITEPARMHINGELDRGRPIADIMRELTKDRRQFQWWALGQRLCLESLLDRDEELLLDRGIPDSIGYFRLYGMDAAPAITASAMTRYSMVFWFEPLPMVHDGIRLEDETQRKHLSELLFDAYHDLGYTVVRVPAMALDERVNLVLHHLT